MDVQKTSDSKLDLTVELRTKKMCLQPEFGRGDYMSNFQNLRNRRYYIISGHQVSRRSRSVSKSSGTIGSTRKNDTYIVYMYTCEMHKHDIHRQNEKGTNDTKVPLSFHLICMKAVH